jgi:hypothetical protein
MDQKLFKAAKKLLSSGTYDNPAPNPSPRADPKTTFACVTLVFLEDWRDKRLTADEVCETLLAAAVARGILGGAVPRARKPESVKKIAVDFENHVHLVGLARQIHNRSGSIKSCELANLIAHFTKISKLDVIIPIDDKNFNHMVETAQLILKEDSDIYGRELAELFLHFATRRMTPDEELRVLLADAKEKP